MPGSGAGFAPGPWPTVSTGGGLVRSLDSTRPLFCHVGFNSVLQPSMLDTCDDLQTAKHVDVYGTSLPHWTGDFHTFARVDQIAVGAIGLMRRRRAGREREAQESHQASRLASDREGPHTQALMQIAWRKSFECGHPTIDEQHRQLFEIGDTVINAVLKSKPRNHIEFLLDELTEHIQAHFKSEEAVLARTRYPLTQEHRAHHAALLEKAQGLRDSYRQGLLDVSELVGFIAYDVITEHIIHEDLKFALRGRPAAAA